MRARDEGFGITILTERLALVTDVKLEYCAQLAVLAAAGIHDPAVQPFGNSWTDGDPAGVGVRLQWYLNCCWMDWSAKGWRCPFTVLREGEPIGVQELAARDFSVLRVVRTGSWLGRDFQGRGYGTEMRRAVLRFAFDALDAQYATTSAHSDNAAAKAINRRLGYVPNGYDIRAVRGRPMWEHRYILTPGPFARVAGVAACSGLMESRAAFMEAV